MQFLKNTVLASAAATGVLRHAITRRISQPIILMYHGVTRKQSLHGLENNDGKHVAKDDFVRHLGILKQCFRTISLQEMVEGLYSGANLTNTITLTFDDGYENNFSVAAPILYDFKIPATFFLATGLIDKEQFIWPDLIEVALNQTKKKELEFEGLECKLPINSLDRKRKALFTLKRFLKSKQMERLPEMLKTLTHSLDVDLGEPQGDYRFMTWAQARSLSASGFDLGAHTVTHPILSKITLEIAMKEIIESQQTVINETGKCSNTFCYPNGKSEDYNIDVRNFIKKHFRAALSTNRGTARFSEIDELRRLSPPQVGFGKSLEWMLLRGQ